MARAVYSLADARGWAYDNVSKAIADDPNHPVHQWFAEPRSKWREKPGVQTYVMRNGKLVRKRDQ